MVTKRLFRILLALAIGMLGPHPNIPHVGYFPIGLTFVFIWGQTLRNIHWPSIVFLFGVYTFYVLAAYVLLGFVRWVYRRSRA